MTENSKPLDQAIRDLQAVKQEHRGILAKVATDPGMTAETRWALIEHLYDEEDEHVAELIQLSGQPSPGAAPTANAPTVDARSLRAGLTVGSLRRDLTPPKPGAGTVGSLRRQ